MRRATDDARGPRDCHDRSVLAVITLTAIVLAGCSRADDATSIDTASTETESTVTLTTDSATTTTTAPTTATMTIMTTSTMPAPVTIVPVTIAPVTLAPVTIAPVTIAPVTTTIAPITTSAPVPADPTIPVIDALAFPFDTEVEIGRSVEGRPITVMRRGTAGGARVLVVGVIHGNEAAGVAIVDRLAVEPVPDDVELWLVRSMNPDGQAISDRQNANLVDLNRNFPERWGPLGEPGFWQYGGISPASEPETRALVSLGNSIVPNVIFWYHQNLFRLSPGSGREAEARARYAQLTGLPIIEVTGGTYTGTAAQWAQALRPDDGFSITVELGDTVSPDDVAAHAEAVLAVGSEFF